MSLKIETLIGMAVNKHTIQEGTRSESVAGF
jgi:hypothetical protein